MAALVIAATSEKLAETDWIKNIEICELVAHDKKQARDVVKAIKKRLGYKNPNIQLYAVLLLEMLMNNIGDHVHQQVIDTGIIPILVKIVKKKSDLPVRERIFLLLDATQTSLGGASGKFPQYYNAYYDLVSAGVQFPQRDQVTPSNRPHSQLNEINNVPNTDQAPTRHHQAESQTVAESSIIQKACNALEVLKEVLDAINAQHPKAAKDEFTLDLVEQCSFQKQRVMHLVMTSRDERIVSRAIELNEQLQKVLTRHDALLSGRAMTIANHLECEEAEEEEEPEQLFRRLRKGKACARPEDEKREPEFPHFGLLEERLNRPLIRPLSLEPSREANNCPAPAVIPPHMAIPPPPSKHMERERYFQENKKDGATLAGHLRGLSLHSHNGSSSHSGSFDFSD
ncbi:TOM1-like protein 5 isoform X1 [Vigna unguiculata]|uniref:Hepatocyte growth factor-regulated tyrosine kinase substrate n=1 Tax=Vigna unguiculata TaxID=3917 RepID=A0A4D6L8X4_VIGUN|nr:TOM1-like protein 5 isoform X1 [Vigna unguiculata]XP_027915405.1 TOM1-like protein 5 isoform X1 [Vigna unguiculata]QCD84906.1 hepatocyte growth factor-regulated tyrosine kinase substrate [Vigna unguiculata]